MCLQCPRGIEWCCIFVIVKVKVYKNVEERRLVLRWIAVCEPLKMCVCDMRIEKTRFLLVLEMSRSVRVDINPSFLLYCFARMSIHAEFICV